MSMTRSESLVTNTEISPLAPAGTIAAFAVTAPVTAFKVDTSGWLCPAGHVVRNPRGPFGTEVKLSEYALAVAGMLQVLERMGNVLAAEPTRDGPPSAPAAVRVSTKRHGATGKNSRTEGL